MFNVPLEVAGKKLRPTQNRVPQMRKTVSNGLILLLGLAICLVGCGGKNTGNSQKQGTPVAKANWKQNEGVVFVDVDGKRLIEETSYSSAGTFSEGLCRVTAKESGLIGFIDIKGKPVIPCQFADNPISSLIANGINNIRCNEMFHCGYARVGSKNDNVLIDKKGNKVLEGYTAIDWDGEVAIVYKERPHNQGIYTMDGKEIVPIGECRYRFIGEGMLACYSSQFYNWGIMDTKGQMITDNMEEMFANDYPFKEVGEFCDGRVFVKMAQDHSICLLNKNGNIEQSFDKSMSIVPVTHCNYYVDAKAIYNSKYEKVAELPSDFRFSTVIPDESMMLSVHKKNDYQNEGFANVKGEIVIPCQYYSCTDFSEGLAFFKDDDGWHIIDNNGSIHGSPLDKAIQRYWLGDFCANRSVIDNSTVINETGTIIPMPDVKEIDDFHYSGNDNSYLSDEI